MKPLFSVLLLIGLFGQFVFGLITPPKQEFIVNGQETAPLTYPFMCSVQIHSQLHGFRDHMCGASILNTNWLLTAAHCFGFPIRARFYDVICGSWDLSVAEVTRQQRQIRQVIPHENFSYGETIDHFEWDFALIRLETPLIYNEYVLPIALAPPEFIPTGFGRKIGWGVKDVNNWTPSNRLQQVDLPIIPSETCANFYTHAIFPVFNSTICSGYLQGGAAVCNGDSGGPLLLLSPNRMWIHLGVAYWTVTPCGAGASGHISTSQYISWIAHNLQTSGDVVTMADI